LYKNIASAFVITFDISTFEQLYLYQAKPDKMQNGTAPSKWTGIKTKMKKIFYIAATVLILIAVLTIYWRYFFTYSDGYRAGLLQKFSNKGYVFKTYEGEMILSSISSNRNVPLASEKFYFSVSDKKVAQVMDTIQGQMVIVHYRQKNGVLWWRGESSYLVDSVKIRH
jgi:hypothetical protein